MPEPFDITQLKLKTSEQLLPSEKEYLKEHTDQLNDEDKAAYASFLTPEAVVPDPTTANLDATAAAAANAGEPVKEEKKVEEAAAEGEVALTEEEKKAKEADDAKALESQARKDEISTIVRETMKEIIPMLPQAQAEKKEASVTKELKKIFEGDPADWDDAARKIINTAKEEIEADIEAKSEATKKAQSEIETRFVEQYNGLVAKHKLPALNTDEGKEMFTKLDKFGGQWKQTSMDDAYNLYTSIPEDKGGGLKVSEEKKAITEQKKRAGQVGSGAGSESAAKPTQEKKYADIHKPMHQIIAEAGL